MSNEEGYQVMVFDGSYSVGATSNKLNNRLALTFDRLHTKQKIGSSTLHSKFEPVLAMEFVSEKSIDVIIEQLNAIKDYKYRIFEQLTEYNGFLTEV